MDSRYTVLGSLSMFAISGSVNIITMTWYHFVTYKIHQYELIDYFKRHFSTRQDFIFN